MNMRIKYILISLLLAGYINVGAQMPDSIATDSITRKLGEVVVKGTRVISKGDHLVLLLSKENRKFGTNALDAVSSLNMFRTSLNETTLTSYDNKDVYILINDVPATAIDLRTYKGDEIKNVEYYPVTPAKYLAFTSGPVVNIVMKKRIDRLHSAYINTSNAVTTGFGTNQANLTYADSLNQVKLNYLIDYRDISDIDINSRYDYPDGVSNVYRGRDNLYSGAYQYVQAMYQRYQSKHLFNANVKYLWDSGHEKEPSAIEITDKTTTLNGERGHDMKSYYSTIAADLFYRYMIGNKKSIALNVVNTYSRSYSNNNLWQTMSDPAYSAMDYDIDNNVNNHTYSLIANASYTQPLWGGNFSVGSYFEYRQLRQRYEGILYKNRLNREMIYAAISWFKNNMTLYPIIGLNIATENTATGNKTNLSPAARIYADWWGKGSLQGYTVQLSSMISLSPISSGQLTETPTYLDQRFLSIGNPNLQTYWGNLSSLRLGYFAPDGLNRLVMQYQYSYSHHPFSSVIFCDNEYAYVQPQQLNNIMLHVLSMNGAWRPIKSIEISPYIEYYHKHYNTPSQNVRWNYWRVGGSVAFYKGDWTVVASANSPNKNRRGDLLTRGSEQYSVEVQYKYRDWSFGARWNYFSHNEYTKGNADGFSYIEQKDWNPLHNLIRINVTWRFSKGKARKHAQKTLNNSSNDTGLVDDNTSKMQ